jgi:hypothetical protein
MKKFGKFLFGTVSLATIACGAYYVYKNVINKDSSDEFDEFDDEFEDFDSEDEDTKEEPNKKDTREYVSINITSEPSAQKSTEQTSESAEASAIKES